MKLKLAVIKDNWIEEIEILTKEEFDSMIKAFCDKHNLITCWFQINGEAEIKIIKEVEGLGCLFG